MSDEREPLSGCWTLLILILTIGLAIRLSIMIDQVEQMEAKIDKIEKVLELETKDGETEKEADESEGGLDLQKAD